MKKRVFSIIFALFFAGCGVFSGYLIRRQWHYCVELQYKRVPFYGPFAQHLKSEMEKLGYSFTCPAFLPKTSLHFLSTNKNFYMSTFPKRKKFTTYIALVGDCFEAFNFDVLDEYKILLPFNQYQHGYLSQFNYKTAYYPLTENSSNYLLCNTDYYNTKIDMAKYAAWLDTIIQGVDYEKL